jgi:hypothetical protein
MEWWNNGMLGFKPPGTRHKAQGVRKKKTLPLNLSHMPYAECRYDHPLFHHSTIPLFQL